MRKLRAKELRRGTSSRKEYQGIKRVFFLDKKPEPSGGFITGYTRMRRRKGKEK